MKYNNGLEREQMKKDEKQAKSFKFTKMTKKSAFLPALKQRGVFKEQNSLAVGSTYMDDRDKQKLFMPDKSFKKGIPQWNL